MESEFSGRKIGRWSEMQDNRVRIPLARVHGGMAKIIMRTNDSYTRIHHMREQVYSIYHYHSSDYTVNRYLTLYFSLDYL